MTHWNWNVKVSDRPVGLTRDNGWQAGVRRTLPLSPEKAWDFLLSPDAVNIWLGGRNPIAADGKFKLPDGTRCEITVFQPASHLRMRWQPPDYAQPAILQVRLLPAGKKTVLAFHQEKLPDAAARKQRLVFYRTALARLAELMGQR